MSFSAAEGRRRILDALAEAADEAGIALAALGEAYELVDERAADRLEERLFRPVQAAYGQATRLHAEFAARSGLEGRAFAPAVRGAPSHGAKGFVRDAAEAVAAADETLAELQDSMLPVEVGDADLRAGLADVRRALADVGERARDFLRTLGR
ncbi:MAG TPA: hypothetical protein VHB30_11385 [Solirubrobacteraceae bacterium]|jgi:hypothetical protein|nr:hypothetical protein [Solirubrobacteraceae bacterium]